MDRRRRDAGAQGRHAGSTQGRERLRRSIRWRCAAGLVAAGLACALSDASRLARADDLPVQPPRVVSMPELVLPAEVAAPAGGLITVVVVVHEDGSGTVDDCTADPELCVLVRDALGRAQFEPARRGDVPIPARVRVELRVAPPAIPTEAAADGVGGAPPASTAQLAPAAVAASAQPPPEPRRVEAASGDSEPSEYGAQARVQQLKQPGMRRLELAEMRDIPGAFGDPFRAVETLPGIVPFISGLPYFYVRGSPPSGTLYYYDGVPVPTLYHLAIGPAVIHPQMVGPIRLYSGVAPARYGRLTGGVIVGEGPPPPDGKLHVEGELRLLDISGYVQADALGGNLTVAGRYGYPGLLVSLISPEVDVAYWDYQLRYVLPLSAHDRFEVVALGSYDSTSSSGDPESDFTLTFHRLEPRWIHQVGRDEVGVALTLGWEESSLGDDLRVQAARAFPRAWFEHRFDGSSRLRLSADAQGIWGGLISQGVDDEVATDLGVGRLGYGFRSVLGVQAELTWRPLELLELQFGARGDAWLAGDASRAAFDPRLNVVFHLSDELDFHLAGGLVHQPAVAVIPLPALSDFASARNLQTAVQSEAGVGWDSPIDLRAELQVFVHRYSNLVFSDTLLIRSEFEDICESVDCMGASIPSRIDGYSYGMELFLRRPFTHALSGVLSYTLAWSSIDRVAGLPYTASWDVRHLLNLVLQWQIGGGWSAGVRGFFRSGKASGDFLIDEAMRLARSERRLPGFLRVDAQIAYAWRTSWGRMRFGFEWFNLTASREPLDFDDCGDPRQHCPVDYLPAIFFPNLSLRGEH